jgi:tyrosyl-tRNA synthetase
MAERKHGAAAKDLARRAEHLVQLDELDDRLGEGRPLRVKLGMDPTAHDVTLGWAVPLRKLRQFQDAGHTAVLIVGDFTARIGDPSGKSRTRPQFSKEEVQDFADAVLDQFHDILAPDNLEVRYNSEWLEPMDLSDLLRLTSHYTVARMLERDDFSKRYAEGRPISVVEFMYPLMQGYDSVAVKADVELGGTDQLFNLLVGRDLQKAYGQRPQIALTMPLLEGLDGVQKMSQSLGNYVGIRDDPADMFGKIMSIPDTLTARYARLATDLDDERIKEIEGASASGGKPAAEAKRAVARRVVEMYHGVDAGTRAEQAFDRQFKEHQAPDEMPTVSLPGHSIDGARVYLPAALVDWGLAASRNEARRLIKQGGVRIGGEQVGSDDVPLSEVAGAVVQVGKRRFVQVDR